MRLDFADVLWDGVCLRDRRSGDIYFQKEGLAESNYVFLQGNRLEARFRNLRAGERFVVGELGFGSGLNFFLTADCFLREAPLDAHLCYVSCERFPIDLPLLKKIHSDFPFVNLRQALYGAYPPAQEGVYFVRICANVSLILLWGEAESLWRKFDGAVNAWFLDGFAPRLNAKMWSSSLMQVLAEKSANGATLATFSAARAVRDALQEAGFVWEKRKGFAFKREMLCATLWDKKALCAQWWDRPVPVPCGANVAVVGAGLAGLTTAQALAEVGYFVDVFFDEARFPSASRVPIAVPFLQAGREDTPMRAFHLAAWRYNRHFFKRLPKEAFAPQEIVLKAEDKNGAERHALLWDSKVFADDEAYFDERSGDLYLLGSGLVFVPEFLDFLAAEKGVRLLKKTVAQAPMENYKATILASAWHVGLLDKSWHRHLRPLRGQASFLALDMPFSHRAQCGMVSVLPFMGGDKVYVGSAYQANCADILPREVDDVAMLHAFTKAFPDNSARLCGNFVGVRASTRDYLPLLGAVPDAGRFIKDYERLRFDRNLPIHKAPAYGEAPLFLHAGLGSKGVLTAPLGAQFLAQMFLGLPYPVEERVVRHLLPARQLLRDVIYRRA